MGAMDVNVHCTALDALVLSEERVLSFRALASLLKMPTVEAQRVLLGYIDNRSEKVIASWVVTSSSNDRRRMAFVQGRRPAVAGDVIEVSVWGVASSKVAKSYSISDWVIEDKARDYKCMERIVEKTNELRDNTWNPVKSATAGWIARGVAPQIAPHSTKAEPVVSASKAKHSKSEPAPVVVKSEKTNVATKPGKNKRVQSKKGGIQFNKSSNADGAKAKSNGAFRSIAGSSTKKARKPPPTSKKTRRIAEESEEEDSGDDEDDTFEEERKAMEAEELEVERAANERDLCLPPVKDEPDAEVVDVVDDVTVKSEKNDRAEQKKKKGSKKRQSVLLEYEEDEFGMDYQRNEQNRKQKWEAQFGKKDDAEKKKYKLIEVEETVQLENGYIGTKRVKKYVDEDGNEKPADGKPVQSAKKKAKVEPSNPSQGSSQNDVKKKDPTPLGGNKNASKPKKKSNGSGNIKNYFGKRAK